MGKTDAKPLSLQDAFLNSLRKSKTPATIFLMKGVKLQGIVTWFDPFSLLLRRDGNSQLVYKHAISTIMPFHAPQDLPIDKPEALSGKSRQPLQDIFLHAAERDGEGMTVFLVNGVMLQGNVSGHDQFSVLLSRQDQVQLVYKHAISTMQPNAPLDLSGDEVAGDGG